MTTPKPAQDNYEWIDDLLDDILGGSPARYAQFRDKRTDLLYAPKAAIISKLQEAETKARINEAIKEVETALEVAESGDDVLMVKYLNNRLEALKKYQ